MLDIIKLFDTIEVNGKNYSSGSQAAEAMKDFVGTITIRNYINKPTEKKVEKVEIKSKDEKIYKIKVRKYMTDPDFDFHDKWNKSVPMPLRIMVGTILEETPGMYRMKLHGQVLETSVCIACGRTLTNSVSKYFGIGPECGGHGYNNPFSSKQELKAAVDAMDKKLREITWEGYVIKKAIEEKYEFFGGT